MPSYALSVEQALGHIDKVMRIPETYRWHRSQWGDYPESTEPAQFVTSTLTCIERLAGRNSVYYERAIRVIDEAGPNPHQATKTLLGILSTLRSDIEAGYLESLIQSVHRSVSSDFLTMAENFVGEDRNNKPMVTAAAVLAGGVLEEHIRRLCINHDIPAVRESPKGDSVPKSVSRMNDDLKAANVYEQIDHGNVLTWYRIRNHAAHAEYNHYDADRVEYMIMGLRQFISAYPT